LSALIDNDPSSGCSCYDDGFNGRQQTTAAARDRGALHLEAARSDPTTNRRIAEDLETRSNARPFAHLKQRFCPHTRSMARRCATRLLTTLRWEDSSALGDCASLQFCVHQHDCERRQRDEQAWLEVRSNTLCYQRILTDYHFAGWATLTVMSTEEIKSRTATSSKPSSPYRSSQSSVHG
jgi:hypothetical protein